MDKIADIIRIEDVSYEQLDRALSIINLRGKAYARLVIFRNQELLKRFTEDVGPTLNEQIRENLIIAAKRSFTTGIVVGVGISLLTVSGVILYFDSKRKKESEDIGW